MKDEQYASKEKGREHKDAWNSKQRVLACDEKEHTTRADEKHESVE